MTEALGPNAHLIGQSGSAARLATPALVLDLDLFERNTATMSRACKQAGIALRPHAKTHKSSDIARRQIEAGALGVCCVTIHEAEALVRGAVSGVLISSPVVGVDKVERLARLAATAKDLMVVIDNPGNAETIAAAARRAGTVVQVVIDNDIGMSRTGVANTEAAVALARLARDTDGLDYVGVQGYSGRVQHIEAFAARRQTYSAQLERLRATCSRLNDQGLAPRIISGGGTGTHGIDFAAHLFTEHQAGSYIFMDVEYNRVQLLETEMSPYRTALWMQNTVVSNNARGFVTIDGGFKCFATDGPLPEIAAGTPVGARYELFGDEHGRIVFADQNERMDLGATVRLVTPHCDPTINLHDYYHCVRGDTLVEIWPIDGRGCL